MRTHAVVFMVMIVLAAACSTNVTREPEVATFDGLMALFADPPAEYRSVPFWVWNDDMSEDQIDRQLEDFKDKGIGGVFIHPRPGLITPYLSDRWFALCRYAVDKGKELEMKVWLYDENSYPSGFAGGHVPDRMPESYLDGQGLKMVTADTVPTEPDTTLYMVLRRDGDRYVDVTARLDELKGSKGDYRLFHKTWYGRSPWYGGYSYVDVIHEGVTDTFIDVTMSGYEKTIGTKFGETVPGVFTDEPHLVPPTGDSMRWTPDLFDTFEQRWGYDLRPHLTCLFAEEGDWRRVRYNYYAVLLDLFIERWSQPWYEYCEKNGLKWTGHYWEHEWPRLRSGPDNMAMYAWHQVPAIDILMNKYDEGTHGQFGNARAVRELQSVANQRGFKRTLSETYGAGGWDLRFEDMKRIGDWEYALGVNTLNQHLSYVTIAGARKRDHPQSFSYHEPWWDYYTVLDDYFGRLSVALSYGEQHNHVLLIEPTTTLWMYGSIAGTHEHPDGIGDAFQNTVLEFERLQVEYDIGSEDVMARWGSAGDGRITVGERSYDVVVIPAGTENLNTATVGLLRDYLASGGRVLAFGDVPSYVDGEPSEAVIALASEYGESWTTAASPAGESALSMLEPDGLRFNDPAAIKGTLFHHRRRLADGDLVFLVNSSAEENAAGSFDIAGKAVLRLSAEYGVSGSYSIDSIERHSDGVTVSFDVPPAGSKLLYIERNGRQESAAPMGRNGKVVEPEGGIAISRTAPNVLTLDYCDVTVGGTRTKNIYFYEAQRKIFNHFGFDRNPWDSSVQFKSSILDRDTFPEGDGFSADYRFTVRDGVDTASISAVVERPERWTVSINGHDVTPDGWWLDRKFGKYPIGGHVKPGANTLTVTATRMSVHAELEAAYIIGDFALEAGRAGFDIVPARVLTYGPWNEQGMPFYADAVSYTGTFDMTQDRQPYFVQLGGWLGGTAVVSINGKVVRTLVSRPWEGTIYGDGLIKEGPNEITVTVYGTLKNLLGPHHNGEVRGTAWPSMFWKAPEHLPPASEYDTIGYGLFEGFTVREVPVIEQ